MNQTTLSVGLAFVLAVGCGDDDFLVYDGGGDASAADAGGTDGASDAFVDAAGDSVGMSDSGALDGDLRDGEDPGDSGDDAGPVDDSIRFEELVVYSNPGWIEGVRVSTPVPLARTEEVELRAVREFFGDVYLEDAAEGFALSSFEPIYLATATLDAGDYTFVVDYPGTVVPDPRTAHVTTRLATPPRLSDEYASLVGTVAELEREIASGGVAQSTFTVRSGHRYVAHGISGMTTSLILDADDYEVLIRGDSVVPFHSWGGGADGGEVEDRVAPSPMYLNLEPGDYTLVAFNEDTIAHGLVVTVDEWALR